MSEPEMFIDPCSLLSPEVFADLKRKFDSIPDEEFPEDGENLVNIS